MGNIMMRVLLDTNVLVAGLASSRSASHALLQAVAVGKLQIAASPAVWVQPVGLHYIWRPQLRDPGDEMVLEAAVNGQVSALVTHNVRDFAAAASRFSLQVLTLRRCRRIRRRRFLRSARATRSPVIWPSC